MRMRFKPYARPELLACDFHVHEPLTHAGHWHELYARPEQPLHLELGCGKGKFLAQMAAAHPENNYIGIDITAKVLILTKRNIDRAYAQAGREVDNVRILTHDIERIRDIVAQGDFIDMETSLPNAEGDPIWCRYQSFVLFNGVGCPVRHVGRLLDTHDMVKWARIRIQIVPTV